MSHHKRHRHHRYRFVVDLGDGAGDGPVGGFRAVRGLGTDIEAIEVREGGVNESPAHKTPGRRHYDNVRLKRAVTRDLGLWQWIAADPPARRTVTITMLDRARQPMLRFVLHRAWPCKYEGPQLNAKGNDVAIETLELCHEGLTIEAP